MRIHGPPIVAMALLALGLAACSPSPEPAASAPAPVPAVATAAVPAEVAPSVVIAGKAPAEPVAAWQAPAVALGDEALPSVRRRAAQALRQGRLYRSADDAIPLYLAIQARWGEHAAAARRGLQQALQSLVAEGEQLLAQAEQQDDALEQARERAMVALSVAPEDPRARALQQRVVIAQRAMSFNRAGEEALGAGQLGEDGAGAMADFRQALALDPANARARQGLAAAESGMIRRAEAAAEASDFQLAARWLAVAAKVREQAPSVSDARLRVEAIRTARIAALYDAALRDLLTPQGLKPAGEKLAEVLRMAAPGDSMAADLRSRVERVSLYGSFRPGQVFTDAMSNGGRGPQMVVVPHGTFRMGADEAEPGSSDAERPAHDVRFERGFAMSITEVTVAEFRRFVQAAKARPRATRRGHSTVYDERSGNFLRRSGVDWQSGYNGVRAVSSSPVMHVSVRDAEAYAAWLSEQTGRHYRLPSEAEFEYALRAGSHGRYPWGAAGTPPEASGNFTGGNDVSPSGRHWSNAFVGYGDGFWGPAPVARFRANRWGLHDMGGNLSEWVADCWHASYRRAPADGAAWFNPGCRQRLVRGGNWANSPQQTRAAWRLSQDSDTTSARIGFRLVRGI